MTKSILPSIAVLVLTIASTTNSAIIHSPKGSQKFVVRGRQVEYDMPLANSAINSDDTMQMSSGFGRMIHSDIDETGLQEKKGSIVNHEFETQAQEIETN